MKLEDLILEVEQHIDVKATPEKAFAAVLHRLGKGNTSPDGQSLRIAAGAKAGRTVVPGSRKRDRAPVGIRAGHQSARPCWS